MVTRIQVTRSEINEISRIKGWILIYGRRKVGKTYLVVNYLNYDEYYFISRTGEIFYYYKDNLQEVLSYDVFFDRIKRLLKEEKIVVIDEFQRLPTQFFDFLHASKPYSKAQLILISSSMRYTREFLGQKSPLIGIVTPYKLSLFRPIDIVKTFSELFEPKEALLLSSICIDPVTLELIDVNNNFEDNFKSIIINSRVIVPALIGEIFDAEDRELTERYELVLKALAIGNRTPSQIANYISNITRKPMKSSDIRIYLYILIEMGLVRRYPIWGSRKYVYKIDSPFVDLYYFLDAKLGISEIWRPSQRVFRIAKTKLPFYYEEFIVSLLAEIYEGEIYKKEENEIDGIILNDESLVIEVKLGRIGLSDIIKFKEKTKDMNMKKVIIADNEFRREKDILFLTPKKIIELITGK